MFLLCFALSSFAFAKTESSAELKPFYISVGFGYSKINYAENLADLYENHIGGIGYNVGFYIPVKPNIAIGITGNGAFDSYSGTDFWGTTTLTYNHVLFALSSMSFLSKEIGSGPFIKADIGIARVEASLSSDSIFENANLKANSGWGVGLLLGGGLAFPFVGPGKALLNVDFSLRKVDGENYKIIAFSIGYLY